MEEILLIALEMGKKKQKIQHKKRYSSAIKNINFIKKKIKTLERDLKY